jgi:hypothetical protein
MPSKYRAVKTAIDGVIFDSKKEAARYQELKLMERAGLISELEMQPEFELIPAYSTKDGQKVRKIVYRADFRYMDRATKTRIVEDVKGMKTAIYKLKKKILLWRYPEIIFKET